MKKREIKVLLKKFDDIPLPDKEKMTGVRTEKAESESKRKTPRVLYLVPATAVCVVLIAAVWRIVPKWPANIEIPATSGTSEVTSATTSQSDVGSLDGAETYLKNFGDVTVYYKREYLSDNDVIWLQYARDDFPIYIWQGIFENRRITEVEKADGNLVVCGYCLENGERTDELFFTALTMDGKIVWDKVTDNGYSGEYVEYTLPEGETFVTFGICEDDSGARYLVFSRYDAQGNALLWVKHPIPAKNTVMYGQKTENGYAVRMRGSDGYYYINIDENGNLAE